MKPFSDFLTERLESGGFSTEDVLASVTPLMRQVIDTHEARLVAPLDGLNALRVQGVAIWFEDAQRRAPTANRAAISRLDRPDRAAVEIVEEHRRTVDIGEGVSEYRDRHIGEPGEEISRPVYLPGYTSWEHAVDHHDPLADVYSVGLILASLACGIDLRDPDNLAAFVGNRRNLFALSPGLHPVLAKAIVNMTELSRHKRPQDLRAVLRSLENYRDQEVSIEYDLASIKGFEDRDLHGKQQIILGRLQERLFEISRRNRLLHFKDTAGTVCLTEASVPLAFDVKSIRQDQILTWGGRFRKDMTSGKPVPLNRYANFREALYLPPTLDRIRAEALRDQAEFGFQQLRMVLCFLRWADVKASPPEPYYSPLVLLPVKLTKKKGVRDTYLLEPIDSDAEVNPVLRHLMKQLYDIDLPETIDLAKGSLDGLYDLLKSVVESSDASITLKKIDRPRIDLIHERARRRLELYRRRVRLSGKGLRRFMDLDYSYDPVNFHPLGLRIFNEWIRPSETHLHRILQERPGPRYFLVPEKSASDSVRERQFYALRTGDDANPYEWEFDLCKVTLGNFRYRKMTLVRDYTELLADPRDNVAFEATFSLSPRPLDAEGVKAPPLKDRFDIVSCDPTQAAAIQLARSGKCYIVQGPPGTGKSQTITNLIADYVALGRRVLFVCEKRAAIDVVYSRLKQRGLQELCCLIHDSQADKREFVMDLKRTYESFVKAASDGGKRFAAMRSRLDELMDLEAKPLDGFAQAMLATPAEAGTSVQALLRRGIELGSSRAGLSPLQMERVPYYKDWVEGRSLITAFLDKLGRIRDDLVLAHHPLRFLRAGLAEVDRPMERVLAALDEAEPLMEKAVEILGGISGAIGVDSLTDALSATSLAADAEVLARQGLMSVLNRESESGRRFASHLHEYDKAGQTLETAREGAVNWRDKLSAVDTNLALAEARHLEGAFLAFLRPSWWRMRRVINERYNFSAHAVRPGWSHVLGALKTEYEAEAAFESVGRAMRHECGIEGDLPAVAECAKRLAERSRSGQDGDHIASLLEMDDPDETALSLAGLHRDLQRATDALSGILEDYEGCSVEELLDSLMAVREMIDDLPDFLTCLSDLAAMPRDLAGAFRHLPFGPGALEAASVRRTLDAVYRVHPQLRVFDGGERTVLSRRLSTAHQRWLSLNANLVRERVRDSFVEHLRIASSPAARLTREQVDFKKRFNRGRRDLEHEFGKKMRYKAIRDLVADESGMVIDDLKPIWLMSPLSVSDTLPLAEGRFDVVIFDEASQITLEEAVPALFRAGQAIVVGDEMQLPPTNFFSAKLSEDESTLWLEEGDEQIEYDLSVNSFLSHAAKNLPSRMLGWHYRSRSESLISFSNWAFYQGQLLTVPEEELSPSRRPEIVVKDAAEGDGNSREVVGRAVSFHFMEGAIYSNRRNRMEADYIAHMVRALLRGATNPTIGIVAFSEAQQGEIEEALNRLGQDDESFRERLDAELTREVDGQFVGLLVKNLENIQGDERDVIIMSVCYGYGLNGKMRMNFGPINQSGGERRLNVAFSRAKEHMILVSSIRHHDITNEYNAGANCLRNYLRYAAACSVGDVESAGRVLRDMCPWRDVESESRARKPGPVSQQIGAALSQHGYEVDYTIGMSGFRCDIGVRKPGEGVYCLGILLDEGQYYHKDELLEREVFKPQLLSTFGWSIMRVLAKDWYENRDGTVQRLLAAAGGDAPPEDISSDPEYGDALEARLIGADAVVPGSANGSAMVPDAPGSGPAGLLDIQEGKTRYFEFIGGSSRKFWEVTLSGERFSVRFGRIGTQGQEHVKSYASPAAAKRAAERMVSQKLGKGYEERSEGRPLGSEQ